MSDVCGSQLSTSHHCSGVHSSARSYSAAGKTAIAAPSTHRRDGSPDSRRAQAGHRAPDTFLLSVGRCTSITHKGLGGCRPAEDVFCAPFVGCGRINGPDTMLGNADIARRRFRPHWRVRKVNRCLTSHGEPSPAIPDARPSLDALLGGLGIRFSHSALSRGSSKKTDLSLRASCCSVQHWLHWRSAGFAPA